jgi:predicted transcriptional regulator
MTKTLELAVAKATALPEATQERIAYELLERIDNLSALKAAIDEGLAELDAGLGTPLDLEEVIREARAEYAPR